MAERLVRVPDFPTIALVTPPLLFCLILASATPVQLLAQPTTSEEGRLAAAEGMALARSIRWNRANGQRFVAALPGVTDGMKVRLVLNSRFAEAVPLEVRMTSSKGEVLVIANEYLEPRSTLEVDLLAAMSRVGIRFQPSSVQVSFFGDKEMIQAWLLTSGESGLLETPLASQSNEPSWQWISFWDTRLYGEAQPVMPRLAFVNIEATPVKLTFDLSIPGQESERSQAEIPALGT